MPRLHAINMGPRITLRGQAIVTVMGRVMALVIMVGGGGTTGDVDNGGGLF